MEVARVQVGPLQANCWIAFEGDGPAMVIDPGDDLALITRVLDGRSVAAIVLTHCHFDHLGAAAGLVAQSGAPLMAHAADAEFVSTAQGTGASLFGLQVDVAPHPDRVLADGDSVMAGTLIVEILSTPGHTPGGICLFAADPAGGPPHLFSGDTLFAGSVGRTDFPRGDSRALMRSIATRLAPLPAETLVHPGHGPESTIGREARLNPFWPRA